MCIYIYRTQSYKNKLCYIWQLIGIRSDGRIDGWIALPRPLLVSGRLMPGATRVVPVILQRLHLTTCSAIITTCDAMTDMACRSEMLDKNAHATPFSMATHLEQCHRQQGWSWHRCEAACGVGCVSRAFPWLVYGGAWHAFWSHPAVRPDEWSFGVDASIHNKVCVVRGFRVRQVVIIWLRVGFKL